MNAPGGVYLNSCQCASALKTIPSFFTITEQHQTTLIASTINNHLSFQVGTMIHLIVAIVAPMLVPYLSSKEIQNLSMANAELRALLQSYLFSSINVVDPSFKDWHFVRATGIEAIGDIPPWRPLLFFPSARTALSTHLPMFPTVVDLTSVRSLTIDLREDGTLLFRNNSRSAPGNSFNLKKAQELFKNLIHLRIKGDFVHIARPKTWTSISFDSLVSLTLPYYLEVHDNPKNSYMASICKSLTHGRISPLRTLIFVDFRLTDKELDKHTLSPVILNLISSDLLPALSTVRLPLSFEPPKPGHNAEGGGRPLFDRKPLLRQLLRASTEHAIINSRGTPWRLGVSNHHTRCSLSSQGHCVCELSIPILWSDEYNDLLKAAYKCERYIRLPEFFTPYLTVEFGSLASVKSAFFHPAAMTPLSALRLSFPPPIQTSLFNGITRLSLLLPVDQDDLTAYQPHLSALPVSFPALTHLTMSFATVDCFGHPIIPHLGPPWPAYYDIFGDLTLPHLELEVLDVNIRIISTERPCGHCKINFGSAQAKRVVLRQVHMCKECLDPLHRIGTEEIMVCGYFNLEYVPGMCIESDEACNELAEWETKVEGSFVCDGRRVTVDRNFVGWT